jgi:CheY-like chemotaxis protein
MKADTDQPSYDWSSKSLLIAEDEYPVFFLLENLLEPTKIATMWVRSGKEALEAFTAENHFDAVLLDIRMPGMDGIETFKELRKIDDKIPIIAQTAFTMDEEREELETIGFNGFIAKPFIRNEILRLIDSLIE